MWIFLGLYIGNPSVPVEDLRFDSSSFPMLPSSDKLGWIIFSRKQVGIELFGAIQAKRATSVRVKSSFVRFLTASWQIKCNGTTDATLFLRSSSRKHSQSRGRRDAHRGTNFTKQLLRLISHGISTRVGFKNWQAGSQTQLQFSNNAM